MQNFRGNSGHTNHCIVKMLHRIAWECGQPAMLFHVAVFRAFQAIHKDYKLHPQDSRSGHNPPFLMFAFCNRN